MLNDIGEITRQSKMLVHLIGCSKGEVVVEPAVIQWYWGYLRAVGSSSTEMVIGKSSDVITSCILHCKVLALEFLQLYTGTIVEIQLWENVPVMGEVKGRFVLMSTVEFGCVLVIIIEERRALASIIESYSIASIRRNALVVHRCIRCIINVIVPLVDTYTQC